MTSAEAGESDAVRRGAFITLEGGEGAGKSTQVRHIVSRLAAANVEAIATREPGGSPDAETLRRLLLSGLFKSLGPKAEAILFSAARIDHLDKTIIPALDAGKWVICDRFSDSTQAYQGSLGHLDPRFLRALQRVTLGKMRPDLTLILDLPAELGLERAAKRRSPGLTPDRFEQEDLSFHETLRTAFLDIAARDADRCVVVDATQSEDEVAQAIWDTISHRFSDKLTEVPPDGR